MRHIEGNLHPDEPWFTLRGQDILAPIVVSMYANVVRAAASGLRHGDGAFTSADRAVFERLMAHALDADGAAADMVVFQSEHPDLVKLPD